MSEDLSTITPNPESTLNLELIQNVNEFLDESDKVISNLEFVCNREKQIHDPIDYAYHFADTVSILLDRLRKVRGHLFTDLTECQDFHKSTLIDCINALKLRERHEIIKQLLS